MKRKHLLICIAFSPLLAFACNNSPISTADQTAMNSVKPGVSENGGKTVLTKVTADEISEAFAKDKNRFAELCSGKVIVVTGAFVSVDDNKDESLAIIKAAESGATIKVTFKNFKTDRIYEIDEGQKVVVQGKCESTSNEFVIRGTNIFLAREDAQKSNEDQDANKK